MVELNSSIIATIVHTPTVKKKTDQENQLSDLQEKLAGMIGTKIRAHYQQHWPECEAVGAKLKSKMPPYRNSAIIKHRTTQMIKQRQTHSGLG